jgi:pyrroline-5-carboxylate reductase
MKTRVGIIGCGTMGGAIAVRICKDYAVAVYDKDPHKRKDDPGIKVCAALNELLAHSEIAVLAVKPQDFGGICAQLKGAVEGKLVISIAAGITTASIEAALGAVRVVRAMPNLGVTIGKSETALCAGAYAHDADVAVARALFELCGMTLVVKEPEMNAVTAISGSGPAYIFNDLAERGLGPADISPEDEQRYILRLTEAAEGVGLGAPVARELASATTVTSIALILVSGEPAQVLCQRVCSKGGTTEAALEAIKKTGSWVEGAKAAVKRAEELARKG